RGVRHRPDVAWPFRGRHLGDQYGEERQSAGGQAADRVRRGPRRRVGDLQVRAGVSEDLRGTAVSARGDRRVLEADGARLAQLPTYAQSDSPCAQFAREAAQWGRSDESLAVRELSL